MSSKETVLSLPNNRAILNIIKNSEIENNYGNLVTKYLLFDLSEDTLLQCTSNQLLLLLVIEELTKQDEGIVKIQESNDFLQKLLDTFPDSIKSVVMNKINKLPAPAPVKPAADQTKTSADVEAETKQQLESAAVISRESALPPAAAEATVPVRTPADQAAHEAAQSGADAKRGAEAVRRAEAIESTRQAIADEARLSTIEAAREAGISIDEQRPRTVAPVACALPISAIVDLNTPPAHVSVQSNSLTQGTHQPEIQQVTQKPAATTPNTAKSTPRSRWARFKPYVYTGVLFVAVTAVIARWWWNKRPSGAK